MKIESKYRRSRFGNVTDSVQVVFTVLQIHPEAEGRAFQAADMCKSPVDETVSGKGLISREETNAGEYVSESE